MGPITPSLIFLIRSYFKIKLKTRTKENIFCRIFEFKNDKDFAVLVFSLVLETIERWLVGFEL